MSNVIVKNELVLSGESKNAILTIDEQIVKCIGDNATIIHTGQRAQLYDNEGLDDDENKKGKNSLFITTGEQSFVEPSSQSVTFSSGKKSEISFSSDNYDLNESNENVPYVQNAVAIATGDEAFIACYAGNSVAISTGDNAWVQDLGEGSIGIATGDNSNVVSESNFKKGAVFGNNAGVDGLDANCTAFVGGENCSAHVGDNAVILSEFPLALLSAGTNSVIVIGWHDGERKRFSTYYQGIDFEGNIEWITEDPETNKKKKHFRVNSYQTTVQGELILIKTDESEQDIFE